MASNTQTIRQLKKEQGIKKPMNPWVAFTTCYKAQFTNELRYFTQESKTKHISALWPEHKADIMEFGKESNGNNELLLLLISQYMKKHIHTFESSSKLSELDVRAQFRDLYLKRFPTHDDYDADKLYDDATQFHSLSIDSKHGQTGPEWRERVYQLVDTYIRALPRDQERSERKRKPKEPKIVVKKEDDENKEEEEKEEVDFKEQMKELKKLCRRKKITDLRVVLKKKFGGL